MPKPEIIINIHGGVVQEVFASDTDIDVILVDWEVDGQSIDQPDIMEVKHNHRTLRAFVSRPNARPLYLLAGSEVEAVIDAAERQEAVCNGSE